MSILTLGFWDGGNNQAKELLKKFTDLEVTDNIENLERIKYIVTCSFLDIDIVDFIIAMYHQGVKIIGFVTEPVENTCELFWALYKNNIFWKLFGSVEHCPERGLYKYPLYLMYFDYTDKNIFEGVNNHVKTCGINSKTDGILITRHDRGGTRGEIFRKLQHIGNFESASDFMRTVSSEEVDAIGNVEYIKKFKFNLCPNAYKPVELKGYIVEKILNACLGCAIPIYFGELDEIDKKIFNEKRIIFYDMDTIDGACDKVIELLGNSEKLEEFYRQDVFMSTAWGTCMGMEKHMRYLF